MIEDCQVIKDNKKYGVYSYRSSTILAYGNKKEMERLCNFINQCTMPLTKEEREDRLLYGE